MVRVHDLPGKIADAGLRDALAAEMKKHEKGKKFGTTKGQSLLIKRSCRVGVRLRRREESVVKRKEMSE